MPHTCAETVPEPLAHMLPLSAGANCGGAVRQVKLRGALLQADPVLQALQHLEQEAWPRLDAPAQVRQPRPAGDAPHFVLHECILQEQVTCRSSLCHVPSQQWLPDLAMAVAHHHQAPSPASVFWPGCPSCCGSLSQLGPHV